MNTVSENHQFPSAALDSGQISHPASSLASLPAPYDHPHSDPRHVMVCYRGYLMKAKRQNSARSLIHYKKLLQTYLAAKRMVIKS